MTADRTRMIGVGALGRVEGEGALRLSLKGNEVEHAALEIYEPPRFFEAFLRGRAHTEPPDLTSRVCGICPVAYQMSACQALEDACGVLVDGQLAALRRLMYCGEWIESQTLHVHLLHAPDFLGCDSLFDLASSHRTQVERGLRLKHAGNSIVEVLGGRAIHPVNARLGGFHRVPTVEELRPLAGQLRQAMDDAADTVRWVSGFHFPEAGCDHDLLALADPDTYAIEGGVPTVMDAPSLHGLRADAEQALPTRTFALREFSRHVVEHQVPYSTALHSRLDGRRHLTGPLARFAISGSRLSPVARQAAREAGLDPDAGAVCRNPYRSIVVRAVEVLYAVEEALRIIDAYQPPSRPFVEVSPRAGVGHGATEAPRGLLYHRYRLDASGTVTNADLVPPTAQNQAAIEADVAGAVRARLGDDAEATDAELASLCEKAIRNHDPCISCSAHFLDLTVERR